ncbi:glutathione S-transferase C-terminal-like protein [Cubamyces lactineus]|nr:glutathione S-transferase C-terminal-like protein [Cubamyces lactineus]
MSADHHFTLYSTVRGPNGWKVAMVLEELDLSYRTIYFDFTKDEHHSPEHLKYNPNGRIPTLVDHGNGDFAIWESDAILVYLVEKYDPEGKFSVKDFEGRMQQLQWLFFQASGQGPYFGQAAHFLRYHHEHIPSAIERYQKEVLRVLGVLDGVLSKRDWLVGDKCTIADLGFVVWNVSATRFLLKDYPGFDLAKDFPSTYKWHARMLAREKVAKVLETQLAMANV